MPRGELPGVPRHPRGLTANQPAEVVRDGTLLELFVANRDEAAFAAIVARHGPMVLNVCRRVLHDRDAAEDAFQATFLVLVRKAPSIKRGELLANWLYGVAYRTAKRAKVEAAKRHARESSAPPKRVADRLADVSVRELFEVLDAELDRLPFRHRAPLVLCYLEEKTRDEAARRLGWSLSTLDRRLNRARDLLRTRLVRHGFVLSGALFPVLLFQSSASARVSSSLTESTIKAASALAVGRSLTDGLVTPRVAALTEGVLKTMAPTHWKTVIAVVLTLGMLGVGAAAVSQASRGHRDAPADQGEPQAQRPSPAPAGGAPAEHRRAPIPAALTPGEAVESFKKDPKKPITVEFGVESAGWPDGPIRVDEDPTPPIMADWDGRLPQGGKFTLVLTARAIRGLNNVGLELPTSQPAGFVDQQRLSALCKQLKGKGVRVTGLVKENRPGQRHTDYTLVVDDPADFKVNQ